MSLVQTNYELKKPVRATNRLVGKAVIIEIVTALLVLLFSYASLSKILEYDKFAFQIKLAPVPLMKTAGGFLAWLIPAIEIVLTLLLIIPKTRMKGLYFSLSLLTVFTIYIISLLLSGMQLPCTCGGIISTMSWAQHVWFNSFFIVITIVAIILNKSFTKRNVKPSRH